MALGAAVCCTAQRTTSEIDLARPGLSDAVEPSRGIDAKQPVPRFRVASVDGHVIDSRDLIGQRAFMLVYFATWCEVCRMKLPMIKYVLERYHPDIDVYGVAMDDKTTWHRVPAYLDKYDLEFELVRAERYPRFAAAYSPSGLVPAVTIVGKAGYLVDYQHGYSRRHLPRLVHAMTLAANQQ